MQDLNQDLIQVAAAQDRQAFARLFAHFAPRIKSWLIGQGSGAEMAEEVAQQAMLQVWRKAALYDPARAAASTWIFRIARNLRIDMIRKEKNFDREDADVTRIVDGSDDPETTARRGEEVRIMRDALEKLPPEQARIVRLSFYEGLAHGDIATRLDLPLGTVKSRMRLAFRKLQEYTGDML